MSTVLPESNGSTWYSLTDYLMKTDVGDNVKIYLTNKKYLWQTVLSREELIRISKNQNAAMEGSDDSFLISATQLLTENPKNLKYKVDMVETKIKCSFQTLVQGFSFGLELYLEQASQEQYYKEITLALLASIQEIQSQKDKLIKIVQAKDEEIGEYKLGGATLFRKCVATKYFNKEDFLSKSIKDSGAGRRVQFQPDDVFGDILTQFHTIQGKYEDKNDKKPIVNIKTEPESVSSEPSALNQTNRLTRPESPVLPLAKRPRKGKLASLI